MAGVAHAWIWPVMIGAGLLTYGIRLSFIWMWGRKAPPPALRSALRYVPPAVLSAIILPELLLQQGRLGLSLGNYRLIAGLAAGLVAWRTRNALLTILVGMAVLYLCQFLFS